MLKSTDSVPREEAQRVLSDFRDFWSKCEENGYVYPPEGWSPFPPFQVAAAMLSEACRYRKEHGDKHFVDLYRPQFLSLSRLTNDPNHQFVNYCEKDAGARAAYSKFIRRIHKRAAALERDLRAAWDKSLRSPEAGTVFLPAGLRQRWDTLGSWDTLDSEVALEIVRVYSELGAKGHEHLSEGRVRVALKTAVPETYASVADRCMTETVTRSFATLGQGAAEGSITGITRDWILTGAMRVGYLPTTAMLKRFRISDPQLLSGNHEALVEELFYQHYWGFGFDCYERSFHNLLDRQYEDVPMEAVLKSNDPNAVEKASIWAAVILVFSAIAVGMMFLVQLALSTVGVNLSLLQVFAGMFLTFVILRALSRRD